MAGVQRVNKYNFQEKISKPYSKQPPSSSPTLDGQQNTSSNIANFDDGFSMPENIWDMMEEKRDGIFREKNDSHVEIYERKRLCLEKRYYLNGSGSKLVILGLDPFLHFTPTLKIIKPGVDVGTSFNSQTFSSFVNILPNIIKRLKSSDRNTNNDRFDLIDYSVFIVNHGMIKFVPKTGTTFELYLGLTSLENLLNMCSFLNDSVCQLEKQRHQETGNFKQFLNDIGCAIIEREMCETFDDKFILNFLDTSAIHNCVFYKELLFNFRILFYKSINEAVTYMLETNQFYV